MARHGQFRRQRSKTLGRRNRELKLALQQRAERVAESGFTRPRPGSAGVSPAAQCDDVHGEAA